MQNLHFNQIQVRSWLFLDSEIFVRELYIQLLGREPDVDGFQHYMSKLERGEQKFDILRDIYSSTESIQRGVIIDGVARNPKRGKFFGKLYKFIVQSIGSKSKAIEQNDELGGVLNQAKTSWKSKAIEQNDEQTSFGINVQEILNGHSIETADIESGKFLEDLVYLNPTCSFDKTLSVSEWFLRGNVRQIRISQDPEISASFYISIAKALAVSGYQQRSMEFLRASLSFEQTAEAHEHIGNYYKNAHKLKLAENHYGFALSLKPDISEWVYINSIDCLLKSGQSSAAKDRFITGLREFPDSQLLHSQLDRIVTEIWADSESHIDFLISKSSPMFINHYHEVIHEVYQLYLKFFLRNTDVISPSYKNRIKTVAIVGLRPEVLPQCYRYRMEQKKEQLSLLGFNVTISLWDDFLAATQAICFADVVIFYRTPGLPIVLKEIAYAKSLKKVVCFETDDLLFDLEEVPSFDSFGGAVSKEVYFNLTKDVGLYQGVMSLCDYAIASTESLLKEMLLYFESKKGFMHRNGLDHFNDIKVSTKAKTEHIELFYGSGTLAHNQDFIEIVLPAITEIFQHYPNVRLKIMGYLLLPPAWLRQYQDRVDQIPFVSKVDLYYKILSKTDINLAVLHPSKSAHSKSEIKWLEAANFSVPSVVSRTDTYEQVIEDGVDGLIAQSHAEWLSALRQLIESPELRKKIGEKAKKKAERVYSLRELAGSLSNNLFQLAIPSQAPAKKKKKIALVNIFFPPNSIGGATKVMVDQYNQLSARYPEYEVVIFTADTQHTHYNHVSCYQYKGSRVYQITLCYSESSARQASNPFANNAFRDFLDHEQPDFIHFHCIQVLGAGLVEEAQAKKIPHFVTIHDAWWISDYQFLLDDQGVLYPEGHPDGAPPHSLPAGVTRKDSMERKTYLKGLLRKVNKVLVVSEAFLNIYQKNGVLGNTLTVKNGISDELSWQPKDTTYTSKVVLGHVGGMTHHKGFDAFKSAIEQSKANNIEVITVDYSKPMGYKALEYWGNIKVTTLGLHPSEDIVGLYQSIDVLFAPSTWPESFGLVTREAAACGCWIVASNLGAIGEDVDDACGFVVSPDEKSLLKVIDTIEKTPGIYKKLAKHPNTRRSSEQVDDIVRLMSFEF